MPPVGHVPLEIYMIGEADGAAQLCTLIAENDLMTALCSRPGSHHATGASTYDQHLLFLLRCGRQGQTALIAYLGIQGAQEPVLCEQAVVAFVAAETAVAVGIASCSQLVGHLRLTDQAAAHENQVSAIIFDYILHHVRLVDTGHGGDWDIHHGLNLGGKVHIAALFHEHAGGHSCGGVGMEDAAGGNLNHVHIRCQHLSNLLALVDVVAALDDLVAGHAHVDGEVFTYLLPDLFQAHNREPAAVLQGAAELVGALVGARGEELVNQPAVACMELNHIKTCILEGERGIAEVLRNLLHIRKGHRANGDTAGLDIVNGAHGLVAEVVLGNT